MDKSADERGNTGPTDGIKTKGDAGTLDAKLIITRRILWWIGLVLLLLSPTDLLIALLIVADLRQLLGTYPMRHSAKTSKRSVIDRRPSLA